MTPRRPTPPLSAAPRTAAWLCVANYAAFLLDPATTPAQAREAAKRTREVIAADSARLRGGRS